MNNQRAEFERRALANGQAFRVAKEMGIPAVRARVWYAEAKKRQEDDGSLGTWSAEDILAELERARRRRIPRKEMHGNLTMHAPCRDDEYVAAHSCLGDGDHLMEEDEND